MMNVYRMQPEGRFQGPYEGKRLLVASDGRAYGRPRSDGTACRYTHDGGCHYDPESRTRVARADVGNEVWGEIVAAFGVGSSK